ncbi:MAG: cytochrome c biogenesis CcdA family protein [Solirubrobacteraceae bacterium]
MMLWALALLAGAISFTSPCCLPLLPGYLAHVGGLVDPARSALRSRTVVGALLFVGGFALVFTLLGASLGLLGGALLEQRGLLIGLAGWWIVAMAALQITGARPAFFARSAVVGAAPAPGLASSFPLGMAFAASWTPCVGPVLAAILVAASAEGSALEGAGLLFVYSLGLGVPFLLSALALQRVAPVRQWLLRQHRPVEVFGGVVLLAMGLLLLSGQWLRLMGPLLRLYANLNWPPF